MNDREKLIKTYVEENEKISPPPEAKTGILLVNTGTPQHFTYCSIRSYLSQFLSDRRVIEIPLIIWWPILHFIILIIRPFIKGRQYKSIWNWEQDEAPLRTMSRNQASLLAKRFDQSQVEVEWAFRYGGPSIKSKIDALHKNGCNRLLLLPLFPQYSAVSSATVVDEAIRALLTQRHQMALRTIPEFYSEECYIAAIVSSIEYSISTERFSPEAIVFSYHGIPLDYQRKGDPYGLQCHQTTRFIQRKLKVNCEVITAFQSRFGNDEWLKPYTEDVVVRLARVVTTCENLKSQPKRLAIRALLTQRHQMALRTIPEFYSEECYIAAIVSSIEYSISTERFSPEAIVFSYHGIPLDYQRKGDPYGLQCHQTTRFIQRKLKVNCKVITAFQSRFGNDEWLKPYTEDVVVRLARSGVKRIAVVAPGFICDCLETIDELQTDAAKRFEENGGEQLLYVNCLNDSEDAIDVIEKIVRKHLHGFLLSV
ncbi:Ferrochelatase [Toxocara canis]|uniref:Ferrochelatase n=1 Tax=Toxocara canis TaxID=6265 RepID=A0A0B2UWI8_TOXCA|nr:Ferrochelatase [Toxocara canis]